METEPERPLETGDHVVAARDLSTTSGFHIPEGSAGTIAEDRGSKLVVFFDDLSAVASLDEQDVAKTED
jgi:hypothetical protein